jgi:hypothetical protein
MAGPFELFSDVRIVARLSLNVQITLTFLQVA